MDNTMQEEVKKNYPLPHELREMIFAKRMISDEVVNVITAPNSRVSNFSGANRVNKGSYDSNKFIEACAEMMVDAVLQAQESSKRLSSRDK